MTGTKYEIERKAFDRFDKILVEMITHKYSYVTINEIENAVNYIDYLKEYRGLVLFDDKLPIPPGSDHNYNYDFFKTHNPHIFTQIKSFREFFGKKYK